MNEAMNSWNSVMNTYNRAMFGPIDIIVILIIVGIFHKQIFSVFDKLAKGWLDRRTEAKEAKAAIREFAQEYKKGNLAVVPVQPILDEGSLKSPPTVDVEAYAAQSTSYTNAKSVDEMYRALRNAGLSRTEANARVKKDVAKVLAQYKS